MGQIGVNPWNVNQGAGDYTFIDAVKHSRGFGANTLATLDGTAGEPTGDWTLECVDVPGNFVAPDGSIPNFEHTPDGNYYLQFSGQATVPNSNLTYDEPSNTSTGFVYIYSDPNYAGHTTVPFTNTRRTPTSPLGSGTGIPVMRRPTGQGLSGNHFDHADDTFSDSFLSMIGTFPAIRVLDLVVTNEAYPDYWLDAQGQPAAPHAAGARMISCNCDTWMKWVDSAGNALDANYDRIVPNSPGSRLVPNRRIPADAVQGLPTADEYLILMANKNKGADLYYPIPVFADDDRVRKFFQMCRWGSDGIYPYTGPIGSAVTTDNPNPVPAGGPKWPALLGCLIFTFGNENWNGQFVPSSNVLGQLSASDAYQHPELPYSIDPNFRGPQYVGKRTVEWGLIAEEVWGVEGFGTRFRPVIEGRAGFNNTTDTGGLVASLVFAARMRNKPLNQYIWACGCSWYWGFCNESQGWVNPNGPGAACTIDELFASMPVPTDFVQLRAQRAVADSFGLKHYCYEGGAVYEGANGLPPFFQVNEDPRIGAYAHAIAMIAQSICDLAMLYGSTQGQWGQCRCSYDQASDEATKLKSVRQAQLDFAAGAQPAAPVVPAFADLTTAMSGIPDGDSLFNPQLFTFSADTPIAVSFQGKQAAAGAGLGLYVDGVQVAVGSFALPGDPVPSVVRLRALVPAGVRQVEVRLEQTVIYSYGATFAIRIAPTQDSDQALFQSGFPAGVVGDELSVAVPTLHHDGGDTYTVRSAGLATCDNPGGTAYYRRQLANSVVDFYVRVAIKAFGAAAGTKLALIGRDTGNCEVDFGGGVATINLSCGSGNTSNSVSYQIPAGDHTIEARYVGTEFRVLLDGMEIFRWALTGANGGAYPGFYGNAGLAAVELGTVAQVPVAGLPTAPTAIGVVPASSATVGVQATGTVVLSGGPAFNVATAVTLALANATPATQTVTVPAGSLSAPFSYTPTSTAPAFTPTCAGLIGSGSTFTGSASPPVVTPTAPTALALTPAPSSTLVGGLGTWVVTLSGGPAASTPTTVGLGYLDATGPSSVVVAAGALTASFQVGPLGVAYDVTPTAAGLSGSGVAVPGVATAATPAPSPTFGLARLFRILRRAAS